MTQPHFLLAYVVIVYVPVGPLQGAGVTNSVYRLWFLYKELWNSLDVDQLILTFDT